LKRLIAFVLVLAVVSSGVCFAADLTQDSTGAAIQVSMDTIEQIWNQYSSELSKIKSDMSISRRAYKDMDAALDRANARMDSSITVLISYDQAKLAYDVAAIQYDSKIQNAVLGVKKAFLIFWQDQLNLEYTTEKLAQKQTQLNKYADGVNQGYLSQKAYDDLENTVEELTNSIESLKLKVETDETTLKTKLGLPQESRLEYTYPTLNESVFETLLTIDKEADLKALQNNSVNLKVLQTTYESLSRYTRSYANGSQVDGAELNLKTAQENLPASFGVQYQQLINQYQDLQNEYRKLDLQKEKLYKVQQQYEKGFLSALALSNQKLEYTLTESGVKVKESALYGTFLSYLNMVAGN
jgi:hypothetical protein